MKGRWGIAVILLLLALVVGVPIVLHPGSATSAADDSGPRLVIVSPHNEQIRFEFTQAFNRWRLANNLPAVDMDWRSWGGTSDLRKGVVSEFESKAREGKEDLGVGYDLFFGGGDFEHNILAGGITVERDGKKTPVAITLPVELPEGFLKTVYPTSDVGGAMLYHPKLNWVGVALSSFGIVYNNDVLRALKIEAPTTWADLTDTRYQRWIALTDPSHSSSAAVTYETILRRMGWIEGWSVLRRVYANARYFTANAAKTPVDVSAGEAAAGMCIDFYGRFQAGVVGGDRVGYCDPPGLTAVTADPISILRGAPSVLKARAEGKAFSQSLANEFVIWSLSPEAQGLWQKKLGTPGGPVKFELRRMPVRRDMFTPESMRDWADQSNPFAIAKPMPGGVPSFYAMVAPLSHAIGIDIHDDLGAAWKALGQHATSPEKTARMLATFDALPAELWNIWPADWDDALKANWSKALKDKTHALHRKVAGTPADTVVGVMISWQLNPDQRLKDQQRWTLFFRENYRNIVRMSRE